MDAECVFPEESAWPGCGVCVESSRILRVGHVAGHRGYPRGAVDAECVFPEESAWPGCGVCVESSRILRVGQILPQKGVSWGGLFRLHSYLKKYFWFRTSTSRSGSTSGGLEVLLV